MNSSHLNPIEFKKRLKDIKLLALDFDGIFTDGSVYLNAEGLESVRCSRRDGLGFDMLKKANISTCIISRETNPVVKARAKKLNIPCFQAIEKSEGKLEILKKHCADLKINLDEVAFMGDDINDLKILKAVGLPITVPSAHYLIKEIAQYTTTKDGGNGAIREIIEELLLAKDFDLASLV